MAKARPVVSDNASGEVDELRRQFNNLLVAIENTADFAALQAAIVAGGEGGVEINGVKPGPTHPRRPRVRNEDRVTMDTTSDY